VRVEIDGAWTAGFDDAVLPAYGVISQRRRVRLATQP
jgi:hypothetical protein